MGERYWITGVQLGILAVSCKTDMEAEKLIIEIADKNFIGKYPTDKDKSRFKKWLKTAP